MKSAEIFKETGINVNGNKPQRLNCNIIVAYFSPDGYILFQFFASCAYVIERIDESRYTKNSRKARSCKGWMNMDKQLFRKASIDRISSPEQLNDYIRVSNPGVWMVLSAMIVLLAGVCVWGVFGHLESKVDTAGICENGVFTCYVTKEQAGQVLPGMTVKVEDASFAVSGISAKPAAVSDEMDSYMLYLGGFTEDEWLYEVTADAALADGVYQAQIVTESVSPMSFILN